MIRPTTAISTTLMLLVGLHAGARPARVLRVCADPNNLPFSSQRVPGFEDQIAGVLARELGATVAYTWWAQRRGFFRNTLKAGTCDVVIGVPAGLGMARTTAPYYRSVYAFVTRADRALAIHSLDDPRLRHLKLGVQLIGDDGANTPPVHALARRGIVDNVTGYHVIGDYAQDSPPAAILRAVAAGTVDVAIVWGPARRRVRGAQQDPARRDPARRGVRWRAADGVRHRRRRPAPGHRARGQARPRAGRAACRDRADP